MTPEIASARLPGYLAGLKRRGGRILVAGNGGHEPLCRHLQGAADANRRRVVVSVAAQRDGDGSGRPGPTAAHQRSVRPRDDEDGDVRLSRLARDTLTEIDRLATEGLAAAELRVCIASVDELLAATDLDRTALFLDAVLDRTRAASGLAHVHLGADYRSDPVRRLEPHFDAVVEVRDSPAPAQRWHVPDRNQVTPWVPVRD
jgi:hypothetical protein